MPGGVVCSVATCKNNYKKAKESGTKLSFFSFPRDPKIQKEWIRRCHKKDGWDVANKRICSKHFQLSDMEDAIQARIMNTQPKRLKKNAIPLLFLPNSHESEEIERSKRMRLKRRKKIVDNLFNSEAPSLEMSSQVKNEPDIDLSQISSTSKATEYEILKSKLEEMQKENALLKRQLEEYKSQNLQEHIMNFDKKIKVEDSIGFEDEVKSPLKDFLAPNQVEIFIKKEN